jgi:hypothetical protein
MSGGLVQAALAEKPKQRKPNQYIHARMQCGEDNLIPM